MRSILALTLFAFLTAAPLHAQGEVEDLFEKFMEDAEKSLKDLFDEVRPEMEMLLDQLRQLPMYDAPEILPNGDIIIRRRQPEPDTVPDVTEI